MVSYHLSKLKKNDFFGNQYKSSEILIFESYNFSWIFRKIQKKIKISEKMTWFQTIWVSWEKNIFQEISKKVQKFPYLRTTTFHEYFQKIKISEKMTWFQTIWVTSNFYFFFWKILECRTEFKVLRQYWSSFSGKNPLEIFCHTKMCLLWMDTVFKIWIFYGEPKYLDFEIAIIWMFLNENF